MLLLFAALSPPLAPPARAQGAAEPVALLVADRLSFDATGTLVAEGNVEVEYQGARLTASRITYRRGPETLAIEGPITLTQGTDSVVLSRSADLDADLQNGILRGARMVLQQQMQIAAAEAHRLDGRYTVLRRTVASTCRICNGGPPLWAIRAATVIHDEDERMLYFRKARFEVAGVPVLYLPRLRMPDPSVRRATGFLVPGYRSTALLGAGVKVPYFIVMGRSADLKFTPYIAERTTTLEFRYRRVFRAGWLTVQGAVSSDQIMTGQLRGYLDAQGGFSLPRGFALSFGLQYASDSSYASEYDYLGTDRLLTWAALSRTRRHEYIGVIAKSWLPIGTASASRDFQGQASYERRFFPAALGGEVRFGIDLQAPGEGSGSDAFHGTARLEWHRGWTLAGGLRAGLAAEGTGDLLFFRAGSSLGAATVTRFTPTVAADLRWPLARANGGGGSDVLEPLIQLAWTDPTGGTIPNEDAILPEFDQGNLIALSRFPGKDSPERGLRAALGLNFSRSTPGGLQADLSFGRVIRARDLGQFSAASGLDGLRSDWLVAGQVKFGQLALWNRTIFDDGFTVAKSESRASLGIGALSLSATHLWLIADTSEGRTTPASEMRVSAGLALGRHWTTSLDYRYDFTAGQSSDRGIGVVYQNECVRVGLSWRDRVVSSSSAARESAFGLTVGLNGVGNDGRPYARRCSG